MAISPNLTPKQVAERFAVSTSAVYMWARSGLLPSQKVGRCVRFTEEAVSAFAQPREKSN